MKMIRYASLCWASVGATKNPRYRPRPHAIAARTPNHTASFPARGKKVCGDEYLNQFIAMPFVPSFDGDAQCHCRGPRCESPREYQQSSQKQKLGVAAEARGSRLGRS